MKYFSHPESDCLFTQPDSEPFPEDPLVCELTIQQYAEAGGKLPDVELDIETYSEEDLKRAGWLMNPAAAEQAADFINRASGNKTEVPK